MKKAALARKKAAAKKTARVARKAVARPKIAAVAAAQGEAKADAMSAFREEYTIEARNFGPIAEAKLTLKPLTVLIGPSNTGKTYMATLACAMINRHMEFSRLNSEIVWLAMMERKGFLSDFNRSDLRALMDKLSTTIVTGGEPLLLSQLPKKLGERGIAAMNSVYRRGWARILSDLRHSYLADNLALLVNKHKKHDSAKCQLRVELPVGMVADAGLEITMRGKGSPSSKMSDFYISTATSGLDRVYLIRALKMIRDTLAHANNLNSPSSIQEADRLLSAAFARRAREEFGRGNDVHFLPASRIGLLQAQAKIHMEHLRMPFRFRGHSFQTHRMRSMRGKAEWPGLPMWSGKFVSVMEELTENMPSARLYADQRGGNVAELAERIEEKLLGGKIIVASDTAGGKSKMSPGITVGYMPNDINEVLNLAQSSSMVGEIAPLVLYLRGCVVSNDIIFVEEPEVHLHPTAQTKMAEILAAMVRAGIRVVITTHSDWLLDAIANLVRQGETNSSNEFSLKKKEVSVYWFEPGKPGKGSISRIQNFDNDNGYLPEDVRAESTALYNKTVPLQIQLEKINDK